MDIQIKHKENHLIHIKNLDTGGSIESKSVEANLLYAILERVDSLVGLSSEIYQRNKETNGE